MGDFDRLGAVSLGSSGRSIFLMLSTSLSTCCDNATASCGFTAGLDSGGIAVHLPVDDLHSRAWGENNRTLSVVKNFTQQYHLINVFSVVVDFFLIFVYVNL